MYRNQDFVSQTLTDAGTVILDPSHNLEDNWEGVVTFIATGTKATGTFSASAQLQGCNESTFAAPVAIGSAVVMSDTVTAVIPLGGTILYYAYYRVVITGNGTQSTSIVGNYTGKGRK